MLTCACVLCFCLLQSGRRGWVSVICWAREYSPALFSCGPVILWFKLQSTDICHRPLDEVKMASHKQSFQCFDTITDDPPLKPSFPHGHSSATPFRGSSGSTRLEPLEDRGCYLCVHHQQAKTMASEASGAYSNPWYHFQTHPHAQQYTNRRPIRPEEAPEQNEDHHHHHRHSRKIVLVKNSDPSVRRTIVLHRRSLRSFPLFMDEVSELMQCLIRKLYTLQGHKVSLFWKYIQ